jgi:AraC-like DNA-binding protein
MKKAAQKTLAASLPDLTLQGQKQSAIEKLTDEFTEQWANEIEPRRSDTERENALITHFMRTAEAHLWDKKFGVKQIGIEMGMSRTSLHRKLKAATGHSAHHLIHTLRMNKALFLLQNASLPVKAVARQVGLNSASHFTKLFVKYYAFLPNTAKEKQRQP